MAATIRDRIRSNVATDENGCWIWKRARQSKGYGCIAINKRSQLAHRVSYTEFKGEIPAGYQVDHLCKVLACVNPDHLEAVTPAENNRRSNSSSAINNRRDVCKNGHPFDLLNTYVKPGGKRQCRACHSVQDKRWREKARTSAA